MSIVTIHLSIIDYSSNFFKSLSILLFSNLYLLKELNGGNIRNIYEQKLNGTQEAKEL
jgi:hypothetical protein